MAARKRQRLADVLGGAILIAAYGAAGAFTASLVEDPQDLRRHLVLSGTSFAVLFAVLLPLLLSIEPSNTGERVKADVRARLTAHDEGRGRWRQLSHARQEAAGWRIDMHDLTDVEGVVATVVDLAADRRFGRHAREITGRPCATAPARVTGRGCWAQMRNGRQDWRHGNRSGGATALLADRPRPAS